MEVKPFKNIKPNKNDLFSYLKKILKYITGFFAMIGGFIGTAFRKILGILCRNKRFARFAHVGFPAWRKKAWSFIKRHRYKIIIPVLTGIVLLGVLLVATLKNTENSDYYSEGDDSADFGMVLQHYSTFDHSEKTHIALHLSWEDGAVDLSGGRAEARIKAKVFPINLENPTIEWKSSDDEIATVDDEGRIEATSPGKVKISASLVNYDRTAEASLEIRQPVSGVFLPTSTITLYTNGGSRQLTAKVFPEDASDKNVVWKSKNTKIARVDNSGSVKPVGVGMTEVIATTEDGGFEGRCFVTVVNSSVDVETLLVKNEADMKIKVGESVNTIVTVSPSNARNKTLKWSSDNEAVATVSQTGRIRGVGEGIANITVESVNGIKQTFSVEVTASGEKDPFDLNTDIEELITDGTVTYTSYNVTFPQAVRMQMAQNPPPKIWTSGGNITASEAQTAEYMNPNNYYTDAYKYQFLDLSRPNNVSEEALNSYLADKGVLRGMGAAFIEAAKEYSISEVYLVAHACLESGNGTSQLARGISVNGTTVYNVYGINAYDGSESSSGSARAYAEGWTSVDKAIIGGAKWISERYINSADGRQNTLYKMRWNPENPGDHEYATDIGWAVKQAVSIEKIFSSFADATLSFDVPVYSGQIPPTVSMD